jgi:hypothetical protein
MFGSRVTSSNVPSTTISRLCAVLIDCKTSNVDQAARFWGEVLGRPVDPSHPGSRGNYRMLGLWAES